MIEKRKEWLYHDDIKLQWLHECNKCGWSIDVNEPLTRTKGAFCQQKYYHDWCYK